MLSKSAKILYCCLQALSAPVAQLDRASDFESESRGFESLRAHQSLQDVIRTHQLLSNLFFKFFNYMGKD